MGRRLKKKEEIYTSHMKRGLSLYVESNLEESFFRYLFNLVCECVCVVRIRVKSITFNIVEHTSFYERLQIFTITYLSLFNSKDFKHLTLLYIFCFSIFFHILYFISSILPPVQDASQQSLLYKNSFLNLNLITFMSIIIKNNTHHINKFFFINNTIPICICFFYNTI